MHIPFCAWCDISVSMLCYLDYASSLELCLHSCEYLRISHSLHLLGSRDTNREEGMVGLVNQLKDEVSGLAIIFRLGISMVHFP